MDQVVGQALTAFKRLRDRREAEQAAGPISSEADEVVRSR
jgi:hypothetical protein